jgi:hypothetical protein
MSTQISFVESQRILKMCPYKIPAFHAPIDSDVDGRMASAYWSEGAGEAGTNCWGLGRECITYVFVFLWPLDTMPKSLSNWQSLRFSVKTFSRSTLAGGWKKSFK